MTGILSMNPSLAASFGAASSAASGARASIGWTRWALVLDGWE
jgi:hypothetical protein